jgi:protein-tyrosine-phosphatase
MPDSPTARPSPALRPEHGITLDQEVALRVAARRLGVEFHGTYNPETIERFLASSYDEFAGRATIVNHLPLLAERFARERLQALSRVEGLAADGRPAVLFLCTHNAGRSQMAMGFFAHHAGDAAIAWSGGTEPGIEVNPAAVEAMAERGIDISQEYPKPWTDETVRAADAVVSMGCGDACPIFPGKRYVSWELADPDGMSVEGVRLIRDDIERRVLGLLGELGITPVRDVTRVGG